MTSFSEKLVKKTFGDAGIEINGTHPWDIQVHDPRFFARVVADRSLGLGESYMDGWWDSESLDQMFFRLVRTKINRHSQHPIHAFLGYIQALILNLQSKNRAKIVGKQHYDAGNTLFEKMLGPTLVYSCAYWKEARNLDQAQIAKLDLICRKIDLRPGMKVLDIGCGWGSFAQYASKNYGVSVVGITISKEQLEHAKLRCKGLPIELRFQDYRDVNETFDRIVSVGQFEHVGKKNYKTYFKVARRCLKEDGLFLLHTIGGNKNTRLGDPWIQKYIFPGGLLPSISQIGTAIEDQFVMEDWHNFSANYDKTLMAWHDNFNHHWDELKDQYDERFFRMWNYYLLLCAGCFRARHLQLWQIVLSPNGVAGGYESIR